MAKDATMPVIVVVMPTYNESSCIAEMIDTLMMKTFPGIQAEMRLLVTDDSSPDGTGSIVEEKAGAYPGLHLITGRKEGLGRAYVRGFRHAMNELKADAVIEMDADFQHDPAYIPGMVQRFQDGYDYVIGSRYTAGGGVPSIWPWHRKLLSGMGNRFARAVLGLHGIHDLTTGFRLTRVRGILDKIELENLMALDRFAFKIDLLYRTVRISRSVFELPIRFQCRASGDTKFSMLEVMATLRVIISIRLKALQWA